MIVTYRHKGLELYVRKEDRSKLPQPHLARIRLILTRLDAAENAVEMNQPDYHFHALAGDLKGFHSVRISGNYRITFRFDNGNVYDVDDVDYH